MRHFREWAMKCQEQDFAIQMNASYKLIYEDLWLLWKQNGWGIKEREMISSVEEWQCDT